MLRLFIIGDSISIQYGPYLEKLCAGTFVYDRKRDAAGAPKATSNLDIPTGANGGDSGMVLAYLRHRRAHDPIRADLLLINCGLHDIKVNTASGAIQVPIKRYEENLCGMIEEARAMDLRLVWINTTPVVDAVHNRSSPGFHRFAKDVAALNAATAEIMSAAGVPIIDLHSFSTPFVPAGFMDHVHYNNEVRARQAAFIFAELKALVSPPTTPVTETRAPDFQLRLWDGPAPGAPENPPEEMALPGGRVSHVSTPLLDGYLPEPAHATGEAIIIFGGGGYARLTSGPRGAAAAAHFLPHGVAVFSLKYRLAPPSENVLRDALADAQRAVRLVRSRSAEWNVNPRRVGVIGFSAGANLALNLAVASNSPDPTSADPAGRQSSRPDFIGLCCAWPHSQRVADFNVTSSTPPAYFLHAKDDTTAPFSFAESLVAAWTKAGAPAHLDAYETGGHQAFSIPNATASDWPEKFRVWMRSPAAGTHAASL